MECPHSPTSSLCNSYYYFVNARSVQLYSATKQDAHVVMVHIFQHVDLAIRPFRVIVCLKWPRQLLDCYLPFRLGVCCRTTNTRRL